MNSSWWFVLGGLVVVLALVVAVVDARGRAPARRPARGRPPVRPPGRPVPRLPARPKPGDIWWADVPYEDGPGSKDRPCLVLSVRAGRARVAKITTRGDGLRPGVIPLPPGTVGDAQDRPSFLETDEVRVVRLAAFRRRAGVLPRALWPRVPDLRA
ncbi:type II toxin-antitoxin system PemK/MazF family toxin [Streptomyces sp. NPDC047315]|uniref:type II toxin-antitoxin system PemK/MazF family toxin n=1 Tax=Streptomyces sp. NPDC047315 TaxID=3155142 RepID=UPI0033F95CF9